MPTQFQLLENVYAWTIKLLFFSVKILVIMPRFYLIFLCFVQGAAFGAIKGNFRPKVAASC
jgi:hypothetical protein